MRPSRVILVAIATAALFSTALSAQTNASSLHEYLQNGGFEDGLTFWAASPNATFDLEGPVPAAVGAGRARVVVGGSSAVVRQATREGIGAGTYHASARIFVGEATTTVRINFASVAPTSYDAGFDIVASPDAWTSFDADIDLPAVETLVITVRVTGQAGATAYLDAVSFTGPPPQTMTPTSTVTPEPSATDTPTPTPTKTAHAGTPTAPAETTLPSPTTSSAASIGASLRNGDFESASVDNMPEGWAKYGGALAIDEHARTGAHAARLSSATSSTKWLYQTVLVDPGASYSFDAWVIDDDSAVSTALLRVSWYASDDGGGTAISTDDSTDTLDVPAADYRYLTTDSVTAPPDAHSARLRIVLAPASSSPASILADDAEFRPSAPPEVAPPPPAGSLVPAAGIDPASHPTDSIPKSTKPPSNAVAGISARPDGSAQPSLVVNEVLYDSLNAKDGDAEWVEVYNNSASPINTDGWSIADAASSDLLPATTIPVHGFVVIVASDSFAAEHPGFDGIVINLRGHIGNSLGNDGDRVVLRDPDGATVDAVSWGADTSAFDPSVSDVPAGHSIERQRAGGDTDHATDFVDNAAPSPGRAIDVTSAFGSKAPTLTTQPRPHIEVLAGHGAAWGWLPWALVALSSIALAVTAVWRVAPTLAQRLRHQA